jgi:hypothetical protein
MGVRRPAFALIMVLLVVGAVFAMTMHSAVIMRSAIIETGAVASQQSDLRLAQGAASLVLRGMSTGAEGEGGDPADRGSSSSRGGGPRPEEREERLELPPIVRQLLEAAGRQIEEEAERELARPSAGTLPDGAGSGDAVARAGAVGLLRELGLPGKPVDVMLDGRRCRVEVRDATGGLNINRADERVLTQYLNLKGIIGLEATRVVHQLLDWRDEDRMARTYGLELDGYRPMGIVPRDGSFESLEELRMLPAMSREIFELIRADLCLIGDGKVHLGSASPEVLRAAGGLSEQQVSEVLELRSEGALDRERLGRTVDLRGGLAERVRVEPSPVLRVRVTVFGEREQDSARVYEGIAIFGRSGLQGFGLRPVASGSPGDRL